VQHTEGAASLQMSADAGQKVAVERSIALDMSGDGEIHIWLYLHSDVSSVAGVSLSFSSSEGFQKSLDFEFKDIAALHAGWNLASIDRSEFRATNGASWSEPMKKVRLELQASDGRPASMSFDDLRYRVAPTPGVVLTFDDGSQTVYQNAFPVMRRRGLHGTAYIISSTIGRQTGKLTLLQLHDLYASGWDIANHSSSTTDLTTMDLASAEKALSDCADFLTTNGMPRAARHVAYPAGGYNDQVALAMQDTGMLSGRIADYRAEAIPIDDPYLIPALSVNAGQRTLSDIEAKIDEAVTKGSIIVLLFHGIGPHPDAYTRSTQDFVAICDYISQLGIPNYTVSEFYALGHREPMVPSGVTPAS
jgi:peptidoglycan/xylan/chitin deacetylase (PgdA/CDA1 family)